MTPGDRKAVPLLALFALFVLTDGAMTAAPDVSATVPPAEARDTTYAGTKAIEKLRQRPPTQSSFDTASLPPVGSITAGSDIRPFLSATVPVDLTRAALRRVWFVDPAIRDVGPSENSWDFNAADGVPGFGSMAAKDAHRLLAWMTEEKERLYAARLPFR
jgi:hypothetical protein